MVLQVLAYEHKLGSIQVGSGRSLVRVAITVLAKAVSLQELAEA